MVNWGTRQVKVFERNSFFQGLGLKYHYITLPGNKCLDIEAGIELNVLQDGVTKITAVERKAEEFTSMCRWFANNWKGQKTLVNSELSEVNNLEPSDLIFLDYLGNLTHSDALWIKNCLSASLLPNAHLGMTIAKTYRRNKFFPAIRELLHQQFRSYYLKTYRMIRDTNQYPQDLLGMLTVYYILITCYLFPDHGYGITMEYYGELSSPNVMVLFKLHEIKAGATLTSDEELKIHKAIDKIVHSRAKGIYMSTTNVQMSTTTPSLKESSMKNASTVIRSLMSAKTSGQKAAATRALNAYAEDQPDKNPNMVKAGIKARITRLNNKPVSKAHAVITGLMNARTAGEKASATRKLNAYIATRVKDGYSAIMVKAGIDARIARLRNA